MFNKILVAMDSSATGRFVFEQALQLAKIHQAQMMLVHVVSLSEETTDIPLPPHMNPVFYPPGPELDATAWHEQWEAFQQHGVEQLKSRVAQAMRAGIQSEFTQLVSQPGEGICHVAKTWGADLILIGNRGRAGLSEFFLGSVSNYVLHHAPCAVLTLKVPVAAPRSALVSG